MFYCSALTDLDLSGFDMSHVTGMDDIFAFSDLVTIHLPSSITMIGQEATAGCASLMDVYFDGSAADWSNVTIESGNDYLLNAAIHYCFGSSD